MTFLKTHFNGRGKIVGDLIMNLNIFVYPSLIFV
jgi:hypothetical protein